MSQHLHARPSAEECAPHHANMLAELEELDLFGAFQRNKRDVGELCARFPGEASLLRYAEGKWSVRELINHLADSERVFGYRMLCIARGDERPLPGFDDQAYASAAHADRLELPSLLSDFDSDRKSVG